MSHGVKMSHGVNESAAAAEAPVSHRRKEAAPNLVALALGSVGVVYGDIGTSPFTPFARRR